MSFIYENCLILMSDYLREELLIFSSFESDWVSIENQFFFRA